MQEIDMNKKYKTRDGRAVRVLCVDANSREYPVVCLVTYSDGIERPYDYTSTGCFWSSEEYSYFDLIEVPPWDDFKIDEPVMVKDKTGVTWVKRYFAGVSSSGFPMTWRDGGTSWSRGDEIPTGWDECRRPTEEELKGHNSEK